MSPPKTRSAGRGKLPAKRPAYLTDYVLDADLEEPVSKNPRFISPTDSPAIIEQFQDAEDNVAENSESSESPDKSSPPDNEMDENLKLMKDMLDSLAVSIESINKQQEEMQKQMDTVTNKIDTITTSQPPTTMTDGTTTNSSRPIPTTTTNQNVAATCSSNLSFSTLASSRRILIDLPVFNGDYKDWPSFISEFEETTEVEGYTTLQNNCRLKKSLTGKAREAVDSMLIHHQNVPDVIERLRTRFGSPDKIVKNQIEIVTSVAPITEHRMDLLVAFADKINNMKNVLKSCNSEQCLINGTLLDELVLKLPFSKRWQWQETKVNVKPFATIEHFSDWLNKIAIVADGIPGSFTSTRSGTEKKDKGRVLLVKGDVVESICCNCKKSHKTSSCSALAKMTVDDRWKFATSKKLCFQCFGKGHRTLKCSESRCGVNGCEAHHHKLLHKEVPSSLNANASSFQTSSEDRVMSAQSTEEPNVLFKVLPVTLYGPKGEKNTFALLDEAATLTLIHKDLANEIGLCGEKALVSIKGIDNNVKIKQTEIVDSRISGTFRQAPVYDLKGARVVDGLDLPDQSLNLSSLCSKFKHLQNIPLQEFNGSPKVLIGLKHCHLGAPVRVPIHDGKGPIAIQTKLGYLLYGPRDGYDVNKEQVQRVLLTDAKPTLDELHQLVKNHFTTEDFGVKCVQQVQSFEDKRSLELLERTTKRIAGRYESGLLWSKDNITLPNSYSMAKKRLLSIEKKMCRDENYDTLYKKTIADYISKGYARELTLEESHQEPPRTWYLPHFGVVNPNKPGKFRLVFDGAAEVDGTSLNSVLLTGPDLNQPLLKVLWQFRERVIGVCGDICEMYHQVKIIKNDQNSQRFLWRWSPEEPIKKFVMDSMTFGSTSSPTTAQFVKNKNASEFNSQFPDAVEAIQQSHYVDDYVHCFSTEEDAINITKEIVDIHKHGGFDLRNFTSNSKKVVQSLNGLAVSSIDMDVDNGGNIDKILGLHWCIDLDTFTFQLKFSRISKDILDFKRRPTKREMLSFAMSIYDPFGFIANLTIHIKILVQHLWRCKISWDDPVPDQIYSKWCLWFEQLEKVREVNIPRCYSPDLFDAMSIELHTLVDASEAAFCAVSYLRIVLIDRIDIAFVAGKTKCAPLKELSVPRLELQAAVLGTRLKNAICENHRFRINRFWFWSDSMTVLFWIKDKKCRFKPFVRNRISEILESSSSNDWNYVPTGNNVADDSTRDVYPPVFDPESRWSKGPEWLFIELDWPQQPSQFAANVDCTEQRVMLVEKVSSLIDVTSFSDFYKLKRLTAWILRFVNFIRQKKTDCQKGCLLPSEIAKAEEFLCRQSQLETFQEDYINLKKGKKLSSNLVNFMPYIDDQRIMRVSGRIDNAPFIPCFTKNPVLLHKDHHLSFLIVRLYHEAHHHIFDELTIGEIRLRFWIIGVRTLLQKVKRNCSICINRTALPRQPMMGQLPKDRLTAYVRPFSYSGVDFFGPIEVSVGRRREKRWVALFTCATVRAIHLEISENLSSDSFILCLRNFINLRGVPVRLRSDNGTNFIGARNEIINSADFFGDAAIQNESSRRGIEWLFNTPGYPEAGGIWERLVQSVKRVLRPLLKDVAPRTETLRSFLLEAANLVNSRPLTHLPISHFDEDPLTPNSFLLGCANSIQTMMPIDDRLWCLRKQWRISQNLQNHFWRRFLREYLPTLTRREKWCARAEPLKVGDVVLICDQDVPRGSWRKGIIEDIILAKDNQVRSVIVRTNGSKLRRAAARLAVLDIQSRPLEEIRGSTGGGMSFAAPQ